MFTGIVEGRGKVHQIHFSKSGAALTLLVPAIFTKLKTGASVSVDGVCLTVVKAAAKGTHLLVFDLVSETLKRTRFKKIKAGDILNLERPLKWNSRVDGHLVQGHVDGVARVIQKIRQGRGASFQLSAPIKFRRYLTEKGSVALNGVSLTLGKTDKRGFWIHGIPHTLKKTNMDHWRVGQKINIEVDRNLLFSRLSGILPQK